MGRIDSPETSVNNYQHALYKISRERRQRKQKSCIYEFCVDVKINRDYFSIQVVLVFRDFILRYCALPRLENLQRFSNLRYNFRFNAIWHRRSVVSLIFCRSQVGSYVTVTPSVTCMDCLEGAKSVSVELTDSIFIYSRTRL
jgi:hypothetical protein